MIKIEDGRGQFYQWDLGQRLLIEDYPAGTEVHFTNRRRGLPAAMQIGEASALIVEAYSEDGKTYANVPNILLQEAGELAVYVYTEAVDEAHTDCRKVFSVIPRAKPSDYIYTETEVKDWRADTSELKGRIGELEKDAAELEKDAADLEKEVGDLAQYRRIADSTAYGRLISHVVEDGYYNLVTADWDDAPVSSARMSLLVFRHDPNYVVQIAIEQNSGNLFTRIVHRSTYAVYNDWASSSEKASFNLTPYSIYSDFRASLMGDYRAQSIAYDGARGKWFIVGGSTAQDGRSILVISDNLYDWSAAERVEFEGHHANDCAYNPDRNELAVVSGFADNAEAVDVISIIDCATYGVSYVRAGDLGLSECHSIAYHEGYYYIYERANARLYRVSPDFSKATLVGTMRKKQVLDAIHEPVDAMLMCQSGFIIGNTYYQVYTQQSYSNPVTQEGSPCTGAVIAALSLTNASLKYVTNFDWTYNREVEAAVHANGKLYWIVDGTFVEILESDPFSARTTKPVVQPIPAGADMDKYVSLGVYICNSRATAETLKNCPITDSGFTLEVKQQGSIQVVQNYTPNPANSGYFVTRTYANGWGSPIRYSGGGNAGGDSLPEVSETDEGKILQVSGGAWKAVAIADSAVADYVDDYINEALGGEY